MNASQQAPRGHGWLAAAILATTVAMIATVAQAALALPQTQPPAASNGTVVDAAAGPCTADFVVIDGAAKPIYNAKIEIQLKYGFMGTHRIDATVGTNVDGKAQIKGLPQKIRDSAAFQVTSGSLSTSVPYDPLADCHASHKITLTSK